MAAQVLGQALVETGQAMQRAGLRLASNIVLKQPAFTFLGVRKPHLYPGAEVARSATMTGDVTVANFATIGEHVVCKADQHPVIIGPSVEVGERCVIASGFESVNGLPPDVRIGQGTKIGAGSVIETSVIQNEVKIGENCVVSEGSIIGWKAELLPGSVVPPLHRIPESEVWGGNPAVFVSKKADH